MSEVVTLSEISLLPDLSKYRDSLEIYFIEHWTVEKFFALRKYCRISVYRLNFLIVLADGLDYGKINTMSNPRILLSFRKRASDDMGFVYVSVDRKGW